MQSIWCLKIGRFFPIYLPLESPLISRNNKFEWNIALQTFEWDKLKWGKAYEECMWILSWYRDEEKECCYFGTPGNNERIQGINKLFEWQHFNAHTSSCTRTRSHKQVQSFPRTSPCQVYWFLTSKAKVKLITKWKKTTNAQRLASKI